MREGPPGGKAHDVLSSLLNLPTAVDYVVLDVAQSGAAADIGADPVRFLLTRAQTDMGALQESGRSRQVQKNHCGLLVVRLRNNQAKSGQFQVKPRPRRLLPPQILMERAVDRNVDGLCLCE